MAKLSILQFIRDQSWKVEPVERVDLTGKTVVVVGANVGLGFEATKHLASMNPKRLVLGCRSEKNGREALGAIQATAGFTGKAELALVDLSIFSSVSSFAEGFLRDGSQIDLLVYNAAVLVRQYSATADGWEQSLQVNHLSTMLLTILLLPCLLRAASSGSSPNPRVVIVASEAHFWASVSREELESEKILDKLNDEARCTASVMAGRYGLSKLLNVLFVRELAKRLPADSPVIVVSVNPGYCKSQLTRNLNFFFLILSKFMEFALARTTEEGSRQLVWAAVGGAGREAELRGGYVSKADLTEVSDFVLSEDGASAQTRIWEESAEILSGVDATFKVTINGLLSK
ncbi:short-chain dehydrogenase [Gloeopeniophorella convolvens]|nr:short-chain dehydrogenase [Gloeopeniophorella convolvens]